MLSKWLHHTNVMIPLFMHLYVITLCTYLSGYGVIVVHKDLIIYMGLLNNSEMCFV